MIDRHIRAMAKEHPHAEATYRVVPQKDLIFGVEVKVPGSFPAMVTSFATEQTAKTWIADYKRRVAKNTPCRLCEENLADWQSCWELLCFNKGGQNDGIPIESRGTLLRNTKA